MKQKITKVFGYKNVKKKPFFSETEIKAFKTVSNIVLAATAVGGVVLLSTVAPNLISAIGTLFKYSKKWSNKSNTEKSKKLVQTIYYLKKSGLIKLTPSKEGLEISLSDKGRVRFKEISFNAIGVKKQKDWDGKWWLVAADVPTHTHRQGADKFRRKLKNMGFRSLQRTLWIYPYDPRQEIQYIAEYFGINQFITVMEISRLDLEDSNKLKQYYGLN
jgi:hypothetical protein